MTPLWSLTWRISYHVYFWSGSVVTTKCETHARTKADSDPRHLNHTLPSSCTAVHVHIKHCFTNLLVLSFPLRILKLEIIPSALSRTDLFSYSMPDHTFAKKIRLNCSILPFFRCFQLLSRCLLKPKGNLRIVFFLSLSWAWIDLCVSVHDSQWELRAEPLLYMKRKVTMTSALCNPIIQSL